MGGNQTKQETKKETLKPCCACPETREIRDKCIFEKGEAGCQKEIEGHKICLKKLGFD